MRQFYVEELGNEARSSTIATLAMGQIVRLGNAEINMGSVRQHWGNTSKVAVGRCGRSRGDFFGVSLAFVRFMEDNNALQPKVADPTSHFIPCAFSRRPHRRFVRNHLLRRALVHQ